MSLFYYFFKTLVGKEIVVELKNELAIRGTLHSVDQVCVDCVNVPHFFASSRPMCMALN